MPVYRRAGGPLGRSGRAALGWSGWLALIGVLALAAAITNRSGRAFEVGLVCMLPAVLRTVARLAFRAGRRGRY